MTQRRLYDHSPGSGWIVDGDLDNIVISDSAGLPLLIARIPAISRRFDSPMHRARVLHHGRVAWDTQFLSFIEGRAPMVRMWQSRRADCDRADLLDAIFYAIGNGTPGRMIADADGIVSGELAVGELIASTIDLDALNADYFTWFTAAGINADLHADSAADIIDQLDDTMIELSEARYADYLLGPRRDSSDGLVSQRIRTGILFGDDPAVTCATILKHLTGDQRLWEHVTAPNPGRP